MGFMDRLGLWSAGTEHPQGFNQFLKAVEHLGCGAMELHAMHLKGEGALVARTLSYEDCNFEAVPNVMNAGIKDEAVVGDFVSAPQQALRKTILSVFPPAPKPRGVISSDFIYPKMDVLDDVVMAESEVEDLPFGQ